MNEQNCMSFHGETCGGAIFRYKIVPVLNHVACKQGCPKFFMRGEQIQKKTPILKKLIEDQKWLSAVQFCSLVLFIWLAYIFDKLKQPLALED